MPRLLNKRLSGRQMKEFHEALLDAFGLARFDEMLLFQLGRQRQRLALADNSDTIVRLVIERAEMETWTAELLQGARAAAPNNVALFTFAEQFGLAPTTQALERKIRASNPTFDPVRWRSRLTEREMQICRVEINTSAYFAYGTGFLLGPDVVMTNYHVVEDVINGSVTPDKVTLRFDYKRMSDGVTINPGTIYHLDINDWLIDASPYDPLDFVVNSSGDEPTIEYLDYALLRVQGGPGHDPIGGEEAQDLNAPKRGWILPPAIDYAFAPDSSLFILQHPQGEPLKLTLDFQSVIGMNQNKTRVRYRTNTEPGSSGSPCFDSDWNLIALHHMGDPNFAPEHQPEYNQGIPLRAILTLLEQRGKKHLLYWRIL